MKTLFTRIIQAHLLLSLASFALVTSAWAADSAPFDLASIGGGQYKVDDYIRAAVTLQAMGREKACQAMVESAKTTATIPTLHTLADLRRNLGCFVLCRMLFMQRGTNAFQPPVHQRKDIIRRSPEFTLFPIELVDGIPFLLVGGPVGAWSGNGPSTAASYLRYSTGIFSKTNSSW